MDVSNRHLRCGSCHCDGIHHFSSNGYCPDSSIRKISLGPIRKGGVYEVVGIVIVRPGTVVVTTSWSVAVVVVIVVWKTA